MASTAETYAKKTEAVGVAPAVCLGLVVAIFAVSRWWLGTDTDVSWLITANEKLLDGGRLYIDAMENNPPAAVYIYTLPVWLARVLHLRPELVVDLSVTALAVASLWFAVSQVRKSAALCLLAMPALLPIAAAILLVLPMITFAQREHIGVITFLPTMLLALRRAGGETPSWGEIFIASLGSAIAVAVKAPLAVALLGFLLAATWHARSLRVLLAPENFIAAGWFGLYTAAIYVFCPQYFTDIAPVVAETLLTYRIAWGDLLAQLPIPLWVVCLVLVALVCPRPWPTSVLALVAASVGGFVAYVIQGKGWSYHMVPMLSFALFALAIPLTKLVEQRPADVPLRIRGIAFVATLGVVLLGTLAWMTMSGRLIEIAPAIARMHPHPKMLMIGNNIGMGHPLVRVVDGVWVGRLQQMWASAGGNRYRATHEIDAATDARLRSYDERERRIVTEDIARHAPDFILFGKSSVDWQAWARRSPDLARLLDGYEEVMPVRGGWLWRRKT
ncbi:hypothetical protein GJW-30_1_04324 [Variibacter gotjawalensis]|uniref:Glycosyltransferase RgtA/B/C/D-like domain-containing protein n=1 Tax=Variibacter gotjawalensis TaxID=1333996 RepID=A0A0S3Q0V5_9BRAD|nr:hypothetical protein [Variibacter gotjawalensis]NIK47603.1 hypothetical protein [Variibacter gotjawalensis]RZS49500.1 4-amino-4-deoxy-L-arabinose transferase-like glycosyltransferase [Variibacter gotjawalensis]BAT61763.1 hypothetical protein GJW-30_1_04324 [Variibacter gotjawalensis]